MARLFAVRTSGRKEDHGSRMSRVSGVPRRHALKILSTGRRSPHLRLACAFGITLAAAGAGASAAGQAPSAPPADRAPVSAGAAEVAAAAGQAPSAPPTDTAAAADAAGGDDTADTFVGPPAPRVEELADGLYVATGYGANVVARITRDGVVVAGEEARAADALAAWVGSVTDQPILYVLRTHRRHGEPAATPAPWRNARLVAPEPPESLPPDAAPPRPLESAALTFTRGLSLFVGEAEVQLHHFAPAHTGRDAVVLFPDRGVLYAGALVVRGMPFIDYAAGGNSRGWVESLDGILALDFETVVPGAGPALTKRDVQRFRDRLVTLRMRTLQLLYRDVAQEDALPLLQTTDLDWPFAPGGPFATHSFAALYDELTIERAEARETAAAESDEAPQEAAR